MVLISAVICLVCLVLVLLILAQNSKGGGLAVGGNATQMIGARRAADGIEKLTWVFFAVLVVLALGLNTYIGAGRGDSTPTEQPAETPADTPAETPASGGQGQ